ncbi:MULTISPECIES: GntR family transcriptional regulator [Streptomyces]|uniref:GntR family transcriptional regulator n=1 Tax=Streptomyces lycopersici TaxID=2974589 RepID=UPI0021D2FDBC|nr:FCD domain-containing protein [Streptomyces sp. NEAU-383]
MLVYEQLKAEILAGRFVPGQRLKVQELCQGRNINVNAMREALSRLAGEGLAEVRPRQGFAVISMSPEQVADVTAIRIEIESVLIRWAFARGDTAWESGVVAAHHTLANTPLIDPHDPDRINDDWLKAHAAFHAALLVGGGSPTGSGIAANLTDVADVYRRWSMPQGPHDRDIAAEHRKLMEAALARDAERAAQMLADHYNLTAELLLQAMSADEAASVG